MVGPQKSPPLITAVDVHSPSRGFDTMYDENGEGFNVPHTLEPPTVTVTYKGDPAAIPGLEGFIAGMETRPSLELDFNARSKWAGHLPLDNAGKLVFGPTDKPPPRRSLLQLWSDLGDWIAQLPPRVRLPDFGGL